MKKLLQRLAVKLYEKLGCREMDTDSFWHYHLLYSVPKEIDGKIVIAEINRITSEIEHVGDWSKTIGFASAEKEGQQ